jgi:hypothetical protein
MEIVRYNSDSGDRDLSTHITLSRDIPFIQVLQKAYELKAHLIVLTSAYQESPGSWYIKGYNGKFSYNEIKLKIEQNVNDKKYSKRICYLIKYFD